MQEIEEKETKEEGEAEGDGGNMQVTWTPGLSELTESIIDKKDNELKKKSKKEKKNKRIEDESDPEKKVMSDDDIDSDNVDSDDIDSDNVDSKDNNNSGEEDIGFDDPFFRTAESDIKKKKKKKKNKNKMKYLEENMTEEEKMNQVGLTMHS